MARIVSLVVLLVILLITGGLFFEVMADFLLPLFLALLLVVIFGPLYRWFRDRCRGHDRMAAALTTGAILLMVLIPMLALMFEAGRETRSLYLATMAASADAEPREDKPAVAKEPSPDATAPLPTEATRLVNWITERAELLGHRFGVSLSAAELESRLGDAVREFLAPLALRTTQYFGGMLVGLGIMVLATYYFFADGPMMIDAIQRLSPLQGNRTQELLDQFDSITRAVVVAVLLSAFVQGLLAGVGFLVVGVGSVFLLTLLSMLFALVPFVGAAIVWVPVCLWLYAVEARTTAAVLLALYCLGVVSMVDNVVKPLVLHGRSNLHPLLAILSVLGGARALGPIGIVVGPMVVAFLQTLLNMVRAELSSLGANDNAS